MRKPGSRTPGLYEGLESSEITDRPLTAEDKREICSWRYEGAYAIYDLPPYEELCKTQRGFMNPDRRKDYHGFFVGGTLIGYIHIMEKDAEVFMGVGVRPDQCGKHYGTRILNKACEMAKARFPSKPLCLEVRTWNARAIRCYRNAGFQFDGEPYGKTTPAGKGNFIRMRKEEI